MQYYELSLPGIIQGIMVGICRYGNYHWDKNSVENIRIKLFFLNAWFRASWFNVNKGPTRCNSMQTFILCHVNLHVSGVMHPSSGVLKTVSATPEVADTVFSTPNDGCMTPETCRVTWQRINVYILLHRVGPLLTLILLTWRKWWAPNNASK